LPLVQISFAPFSIALAADGAARARGAGVTTRRGTPMPLNDVHGAPLRRGRFTLRN